MAALVCDICGGKLAMGSGGIAVCDSCGMEHTKERMQEKVQEIKGTVRVDNSHMIDNYLTMAENAYEAENKSEAEMYCNKIIEIDAGYYRAWFLKGKAAGWQSTIANSRLSEAATCFAKAIDLAREEEREAIQTESTDEMNSLATALIRLRGDRFSKYPDEEEANGFLSDIGTILSAVMILANKSGAVTTGFMEEIASNINQSVTTAWGSKIEPEYTGTENHPSEYEWREFISRIGYCTMLLEKAIELSDEDADEDIQRYENLIFLHRQAINSCSWKEEYNSFWQNFEWKREYFLADTAKNLRRKMISDYENNINEIKNKSDADAKAELAAKEKSEREALENRVAEYWNAHHEEKLALEAESSSLIEQIEQLRSQKDNILESTEMKNLSEKRDALTSEKANIGIFKVKEKKILQEQIDSLSEEIKKVEKKRALAESKIQDQIAPLQNRVTSILVELSQAR